MFNNISTHFSNARSVAFEYKNKIATFLSQTAKAIAEFAGPKFHAITNYPIREKTFAAIELTKDQARKHPALASIIVAIPVAASITLWAYRFRAVKTPTEKKETPATPPKIPRERQEQKSASTSTPVVTPTSQQTTPARGRGRDITTESFSWTTLRAAEVKPKQTVTAPKKQQNNTLSPEDFPELGK